MVSNYLNLPYLTPNLQVYPFMSHNCTKNSKLLSGMDPASSLS